MRRPTTLYVRLAMIALLTLGLLLAPLCAGAQQPSNIPRVGLMEYAPSWEPFLEGLRQLGYVEGRNIGLERRSAVETPDQLPSVAAELVRLKVDVLVTLGTPATRAAKQATRTIPIVMIAVADPRQTGLVTSFARPGGNITGLTIVGPELAAKRLQLLKEVVPGLSRVAFLWNPANQGTAINFESAKTGARSLGVTLQSVAVRSPAELESAFAAMMRERPDGFMMTADPMHLLQTDRIVDFIARNRLPAIYQVRESVVAGGLMSYGASRADLFRRAATYVDKILKGVKPADLPVEEPTQFELVINLKTAKAIGVTFPALLRSQADEVIE
jgi:putative ABC transport system substrate-binding protein